MLRGMLDVGKEGHHRRVRFSRYQIIEILIKNFFYGMNEDLLIEYLCFNSIITEGFIEIYYIFEYYTLGCTKFANFYYIIVKLCFFF